MSETYDDDRLRKRMNEIGMTEVQLPPVEIKVEPHPLDAILSDPPEGSCLFCLTMLDWLREAWPEGHLAELPHFEPRQAKPIVRTHNQQADAMPFCETCSKMYMAMLGQFHRERQEREGQEPEPLRARVSQSIATPSKTILKPGDPGFGTRS